MPGYSGLDTAIYLNWTLTYDVYAGDSVTLTVPTDLFPSVMDTDLTLSVTGDSDAFSTVIWTASTDTFTFTCDTLIAAGTATALFISDTAGMNFLSCM